MKSEIGDEDDDGMSQELAPLVLPLFLLRIGESKTRVVHLGTYDEEVEKVHYALFLRCHHWGESLAGVYVVLNFFSSFRNENGLYSCTQNDIQLATVFSPPSLSTNRR